MTLGDDQHALLKARVETLEVRVQDLRWGRRVLMELFARQLEEKRRLTQRLHDTERRLHRANLRCLRVENARGSQLGPGILSWPERG